MRDVIFVICIALVSFLFGAATNGGKSQKSEPVVQQVNIDQQCVAWFFETNIKEAREKICKRK